MRIILPTLLALASASSVATATPQDRERTARVSYTKTPAPAADQDKAQPKDWVELATPTPCSNGRTWVTLEAETPFKRLRVDASKGRPVIKGVRVTFTDGKSQYFKLAKRLDVRGERSSYVDLKGAKQIESIIIDSDWRAKGSYTVHGAPDRTAIATR